MSNMLSLCDRMLHILTVNADNKVYAFGRAEEGRLGLQFSSDSSTDNSSSSSLAATDRVLVPTEVTALREWTQQGYTIEHVYAGGTHSAALLVQNSE
jgi:alpha-tubulin suppressor-like RCC1 family protein